MQQTVSVRVLLRCLEPASARELMNGEGRTNLTKFRNTVLAPLIAEGLLELTIPDKPTSRLKKYSMTEKGKEYVATIERNGQPKTMTMVFDSHGRSRGCSVAPVLATKNNARVVEVYSLDDKGDGGKELK